MNADLNGAYTKAMRWYPKRWRRENEQAVIGVLLDTAEAEGRTTPTVRERRDLALHGIRQRLICGVPTFVRDRVASASLAAGAAFAVFYVVVVDWSPWVPRESFLRPGSDWSPIGPFATPYFVIGLLYVCALATALLRRNGISRGLLVAIAVVSVAMAFGIRPGLLIHRPEIPTLVLSALLAVAALIGRPSHPARLGAATGAWTIGLLAASFYGHAFHLNHNYLGSFFWTVVADPNNLAMILDVALLLAFLLIVVGRLRQAAIVFFSVLPWAAAWAVGSVAYGWNSDLLSLITLIGLVSGAVVAVTWTKVAGRDRVRTIEGAADE